MRYLIIFGLVIVNLLSYSQESAVSPFIAIPALAQQIKNVASEKDLMELYAKFERDYPEDKFAQVHFLLDQVYHATAEKMIVFNNDEALKYIIKIRNTNDRIKMLEALPVEYWQLASTNSLVYTYYENHVKEFVVFNNHNFVYAELLMYSGKPKESLEFLEKFPNVNELIAKHPYLFINLYQKNNQIVKGINILGTLLRQGKSNESSRKILKELWIQHYGNEEGLEAYFDEQLQALTKVLESDLLSKMVSYDAPDFELRNLEGEIVRLTDFKGKVVFLDFWATWCGPCIASFPTMQRVIKQFEANADVVFLFVNTMERNANEIERVKKVKQLFDEKGFNFEVILDIKNETNYELSSKYKLSSIPAQFLIDRKGKVRFFLNGFNGDSEKMYHELNTLIKNVLIL